VVVPWVAIDTQATLDSVIATLQQTQRRDASPGTALGVAMQEGADHLGQQAECWKRTLDVSGDGKSNLGPRPRDVKERLKRSGITINALVIGVDDPNMGDIRQAEIGELSSYFKAEVILGPDAFVQTAIGFNDYARAMTEKLIRELDGLVFSMR
jgi:cell pole-organizing protein PopZ